MLTRTLISPEILEVREDILGFTDTKTRYSYTNIETWEDLSNPYGTKQTGNFKVARKLVPQSIDWCMRYHLPKAVVGY